MAKLELLVLILVPLVGLPRVHCDGPLKIYAKGYNKRNLPKNGGWTKWFNTYFGHGSGDHEHIYDVWRIYGRGCSGLPCRKPLAMKIISTHWLSPMQEGNEIKAQPNKGMECHNHHQFRGRPCADYMVRFYCPEMGARCRRKQRGEKWQQLAKGDPEKLWNDVIKRKENRYADGKAVKSEQSGKTAKAFSMGLQNGS